MNMILTNVFLIFSLIVGAALCDTDTDISIASNKGKPEIVILKEVIDILQQQLNYERTARAQSDQDLKDLTEKHRQLTMECDDVKADNVHLTDQYSNVSILTTNLETEIKQQQVEMRALTQRFEKDRTTRETKFAEMSKLVSRLSVEKDEIKAENVRFSESLKKDFLHTTTLRAELKLLKQLVQNDSITRTRFDKDMTEMTKKLNDMTEMNAEIKAEHLQQAKSCRNYTDRRYNVLLASVMTEIEKRTFGKKGSYIPRYFVQFIFLINRLMCISSSSFVLARLYGAILYSI